MARVLIVEDDAINAELLAVICKGAHHVVTVVSNGLEALMMLDALPFDLMLCDLMMPKMDGCSLIRLIRSSLAPYAAIPIVVVTARLDAESRHEAQAAGAAHVLTKPFEKAVLLTALHQALNATTYNADTIDAYRSNELRREAHM